MDRPEIGFIVDAGAEVGYGHAVRCLRLATALAAEASVTFHPLSEACRRFFAGRGWAVRPDGNFPPVVVTDLSRPHPVTEAIERQGCLHISIRDLGLAQCRAHLTIDGSITHLVPYVPDDGQRLFAGPEYMVLEPATNARRAEDGVVLVTLGGGASRDYVRSLARALASAGFHVYATKGFGAASKTEDLHCGNGSVEWIEDRTEIENAATRAQFAITNAGVSLYEMLAAGVPAISLSVDALQLQTAEAFESRGAAANAGLVSGIAPLQVAGRAARISSDREQLDRMAETGRNLVDGKGLSRVTEIMRRELCPTA